MAIACPSQIGDGTEMDPVTLCILVCTALILLALLLGVVFP